jgi:hypothetical protein
MLITLRFLWFSSILNYVVSALFHVLSNSLFTITPLLDAAINQSIYLSINLSIYLSMALQSTALLDAVIYLSIYGSTVYPIIRLCNLSIYLWLYSLPHY